MLRYPPFGIVGERSNLFAVSRGCGVESGKFFRRGMPTIPDPGIAIDRGGRIGILVNCRGRFEAMGIPIATGSAAPDFFPSP